MNSTATDITVELLHKPLTGSNATASNKLWLQREQFIADCNRIRKEVKQEYPQHKITRWLFQVSFCFACHLFGKSE